MPENVENLILEHLRAGQNRIEDEIKEVKHRLTSVEAGVAGLRRDPEDVYHQQAAIDKIKERLERIEKRLELLE